MKNKNVSLQEAVRFHGHLGPYLVLGLKAGELALRKLRAKKYFEIKIKVRGANKKPRSCLIDGLQLSTGATYGKGNISKLNGAIIDIGFFNKLNNRRINISLKEEILRKLNLAKSRRDSESLAKDIYSKDYSKLFELMTGD